MDLGERVGDRNWYLNIRSMLRGSCGRRGCNQRRPRLLVVSGHRLDLLIIEFRGKQAHGFEAIAPISRGHALRRVAGIRERPALID